MIAERGQAANGYSVVIRKCSIADIEAAPNAIQILAEYEHECATPGVGKAVPQWDIYRAIESTGVMQAFGAYVEGHLVGFITVTVMRHPHYAELIGSYESYFVLSEHRGSGAGMALLRAAKEHARELGAVGLFVNSAPGSNLDRVLTGIGARHTHNVRFISLCSLPVTQPQASFPAMSADVLKQVAGFGDALAPYAESTADTDHVLHAGTYARTLKLPAGMVLVGALVKVDTVVVFHGKARVFVGDEWLLLDGYHVIPAGAMRSQVFVSITDCYITAIFATVAKTVAEAEEQATGNPDGLLSRAPGSRNSIFNSGETPCLMQT